MSRFWATDKYTAFRFEDETFYLEDSLSELEALLADHGFLRVHRGELINLAAVRSLVSGDEGLQVELRDGQMARVSRRLAKTLKVRLRLV